MQKKIFLFVIIGAFLVLTAGRAAAIPHFTPNELKTAESLDPGMTQTGINFSLGDNFTSYYAEIRYGMGAMMELGVKFGATAATLDARVFQSISRWTWRSTTRSSKAKTQAS